MGRAVVGALIGGLVGAAAWAAVSHFLELEIGWLAWGIGVLVGLGAQRALDGEATPATGAMAAVVALLAVLGGKWVAVHLWVTTETEAALAETSSVSDELATSYLADAVALEREEAGDVLVWPERDPDLLPAYEEDYPADVWAEAASRWDDLSPAERTDYKAARLEEMHTNIRDWSSAVKVEAFQGSFGGLDLLFLGLAIVTAFKLGSSSARVAET